MNKIENSRIWETYKTLLQPARNEAGAIVAAEFPHENHRRVSCAFGLGNVMQHLVDTYYVMLTDDDKAKHRPRKKRRTEGCQNTLLGFSSSKKMTPDVMAKACAVGALPLSLAQNPGIRFICDYYEGGGAFAPSRMTVTRHVDDLYASTVATMSKNLELCRQSDHGDVFISVTFDIWTSKSRHGHLGLNAFVLDKDFVMRSFAISCVAFPYPHTAERIAEQVVAALAKFNVSPSDLMAVATDNESAAVAAARKVAGTDGGKDEPVIQLNSLSVSTPCACHSMNLCGEAASLVASFHEAFSHLTDISSFFGWPKRTEILEKKLEDMNLKAAKFIDAAPTRWNYTAQVVQRAIDMAPAVIELSSEELDIAGAKEKEAWDTMRAAFGRAVEAMRAVAPLLHRIDIAMRILSSNDKVTISRVFPEALELWELAESLSKSDSIVTRDFAIKFRDEINERFYLKPTAMLFHCAELLDPVVARDKMTEEGAIGIMRLVRDALADAFYPEDKAERGDVGPDIFGEVPTNQAPRQGHNADFRTEFGRYLGEIKNLSGEQECLPWWRVNRLRFPLVAHVARSILSAQASTAESERLFSVGAFIINKWRTRLTGQHAEKTHRSFSSTTCGGSTRSRWRGTRHRFRWGVRGGWSHFFRWERK